MLSRGFLRTLWLWRSDHFFACGHASQLNSQEILASAHYPSSTRSDEGLESKRGADVTYHTGKYNLALKSRESGRNPHTIHTRGSTRTVTRQDLGRVSSNRIIMESSSSQLVPQVPPTNYETYVLEVLTSMTARSSTIDQAALRQCLGLSSSYQVSDTTTNPTGGVASWTAGLSRLVDVLTALHSRGELELETINAASKACSECWTVASNWRGTEECKESIRKIAVRLKRLLDENGRTFGGERVYVP